LVEAVKYVTSLANLKYRVRAEGVEIAGSWPDTDSLKLREFKVDPKALEEKGLKSSDDVRQFFGAIGASFPEGSTAARASEDRLIVKSTQEDLDLVEAWLAIPSPSESEIKPFADPVPEELRDFLPPIAEMQRKLSRIIIPRIEFRQASVREAVEFLTRKSAELDKEEPDAAKRGISVVLKPSGAGAGAGGGAAVQPSVPSIPGLGAVSPAPPPGDNDLYATKVTLSLTNIPLGEALRYVATLANLRMTIEPNAVVMAPAVLGEMITKEYTLPNALNDLIRENNAKDFLMKRGNVSFPEGASAVYVHAVKRLIVRNTAENQQRVIDLIRGAGK
jgi:hypothetical protein